MNRFWGQNPAGSAYKLSRDENQLFSLNYENLCDADYLNRLFTIQSGEQLDLQGPQAPLKDNESWMLTADTAEDVIVFGQDFSLGKHLLQKRFLTGITSTVGNHDILSTLVQRQVIVFENIGRLVEANCLRQERLLRLSEGEIGDVTTNPKSITVELKQKRRHLASEALCCALKTLAKHSRNQLQRSAVEPILSLLLSMYQEQGSKINLDGAASRVDEMHLRYLREILCNGVEHGIELFAACTHNIGIKQNEEHLKLSLSCAYGLLSIGIYAQCPGDVLMAFLHLASISLLLNECQSFLHNDRELETSSQTNNEEPLESSDNVRNSMEQILNENEDLQKTNLKLKLKMKNKDICTNLFPFITKIPATGASSASAVLNEQKPSLSLHQSDLQNQQLLQQQLKIKNKSAKWEVANNKSPIPISEKAKDAHIQSASKMKIQLVKSRHFGAEDFSSNKLYISPNPTRKMVPKKCNHMESSVSGNNNEDRSSPNFDSEIPAQYQNEASTRDGRHEAEYPMLTVAAVARAQDSRNIDTYNALRASLKCLSRIPKSVLRVVRDGCTEYTVSKLHSKFSAADSSQYKSAIAAKSYVWSCGQNSYGELGHCDGSLRKSFTKISFLEGKGVVSVGAGNEHSIFVCDDGKVFVTGYNDNGQCGNGKTDQVKSPQQISALDGEDIAEVYVFNGCEHTLVTTRDGKLYTFGYNYRGQLGHGNTTIESIPRLVKSLLSKKVITAACSYHHSVLLCSDGTLHSCGRNDCGQLGHGDTVDKKIPFQVTSTGASKDGKIAEISCGQFHTVMLTARGVAYACGKNDYGQTCLEGSENVKIFTRTSGQSESDAIRQVCCGYYHTLLLSQSGIVTGFGRNDYGQLGLGHSQARVFGGHTVAHLRDKNVIALASGCYHSVAVTSNGMLYTFGRNNHGQLGTGDQEDRNCPHPVDNFIGCTSLKIAAGFYHTIVVAVDASVESVGIDSEFLPAAPSHTRDPTQTHPNSPTCSDVINSSPKKMSSHVLFQGIEKKSDRDAHDKMGGGVTLGCKSRTASINELLSFLVGYIEGLVISAASARLVPPVEDKNASKDEKDKAQGARGDAKLTPNPSDALGSPFVWLVKQIRAMYVLLEMTRGCLARAHDGSRSRNEQEGAADLPLSDDDVNCLLRTLMRTADQFLHTQKAQLQKILFRKDTAHADVGRKGEERSFFPSKESDYPIGYVFSGQPTRVFSALELIQEVQGDLMPLEGVGAGKGGSVDVNESKVLRNAISRLRREMVLTYLKCKDHHDGPNHPHSIVGDFGSCLSSHFETLFFSDTSRSEFFCFLGGILSKKTMDLNSSPHPKTPGKECDEYSRCLSLFLLISLKYRRIGEVIKLLCRPRRHFALTVFQQLIAVYSHLSVHSLENRTAQTSPLGTLGQIPRGLSIPNGELCRALATLEQCNANFVKCAIPLIFSSTVSLAPPVFKPYRPLSLSSSHVVAVVNDVVEKSLDEREAIRMKEEEEDERKWVTHGASIIRDIFISAESVLDLLGVQSLTDDIMNVLRYGTVVPSMLPTILIYGISSSRSQGCVQDLLPLVRSLTKKIQALIPGKDADVPSLVKSGSGSGGLNRSATSGALIVNGPSSTGKVDSGSSIPSTGTASNSEKSSKCIVAIETDKDTSTVVTPPSPAKKGTSEREKDFSHSTWWSRLLKLATVLNARLAASLIHDPVNYLPSSSSKTTDNTLAHHSVWAVLSPPEDLAALSQSVVTSRSFIQPVAHTTQKPGSARSKHLAPLTPNTVAGGTNTQYIKMLNKCVCLRDLEAMGDSVYRSIQQMVKKSVNAKVLVLGIEHVLFEAAVYIEGSGMLDLALPTIQQGSGPGQGQAQGHGRKDRCSGVWKAIAKLTKRIQSQRSILVSNNNNLNWMDILTVLLRQSNAIKDVILASTCMIVTCPILLSAKVRKHPSLRRAILRIICIVRWKAAVRLRLKSLGVIVVDFMCEVLEEMTQGLTCVGPSELMNSRWEGLLLGLRAGSSDVTMFSKGLLAATETLQATPFSSVKHDVLSFLIMAWRDRVIAERDLSVAQGTRKGKADTAALCCTESVWKLRKQATQGLEDYLCGAVKEFSTVYLSGTPVGTVEVNFFSLVLSLLQLLSIRPSRDTEHVAQSRSGVCCVALSMTHKTIILKSLRSVFIAIDVRTLDPNAQILEERTANAMRARGVSRDRNKALRKASNAVVSLLQAYASRETSPSLSGGNLSTQFFVCNMVMDTHNELLVHLEKVRLAAQQQVTNAEQLAALSNLPSRKGSSGDPKENVAVGTIATSSMISKVGVGLTKESSKRRCQELIVPPMEFCRTQEGFVVQGDNLLSNFKGIDFTLATWLFIDKKAAVRHSFVTGKVSHHDAWPLVVLRNDGKLDIIYGHSNDFECMTSVASIPLYTWSHVAVVIEQKKIKLFINGSLDSQVGTKGNARAVMYPIVVGRCPQGLRTHVDQVRVGFDGLLAQYRYYTRALSPIHVRVVFDQGPPETYDIRERWLYKLLASSRLLLEARSTLSDASTRAHADVLLGFFITDSTRRVRTSALMSLQFILAKDTLTDLKLVCDFRGRAACMLSTDSPGAVLVSECSVLADHTPFRERLVLYFIRLIGACWSPELTAGAVESTHYDVPAENQEGEESKLLAAFLSYAPTIFNEKFLSTAPSTPPIFTPPVQSAGLSDRTAARDASVGELSYHVLTLLRSLSSVPPWASAIAAVLTKTLSYAPDIVSTPALWGSLKGIEILGAAVFLGESCGGPYLGATTISHYSISPCRVLSIHKATSIAIVLSCTNIHSKRQLSTVRLGDLTNFPLPFSFKLQPRVLAGIISVLDALKGFTGAAVSDLLCTFKSEHPFLRHHLLRILRPVEVLTYHQLLRSLSRADSGLNSDPDMLRSHPDLFRAILQTCARTMRLPVPASRNIISYDIESESSLPRLWTNCAPYIAAMPKKLTTAEFPPDDLEKIFQEYVEKAVGVAMGRFEGPQETLIRRGLLPELVVSNSNATEMQSDMCANLFLDGSDPSIPSTDWGVTVPATGGYGLSSSVASLFGSAARTTTHLLTTSALKTSEEQDAAVGALKLMTHLRESIIKCSRHLVTRHYNLLNKETFASYPLPWRILMWHSFATCYPSLPPSAPSSSNTYIPIENLSDKRRSEKVGSGSVFDPQQSCAQHAARTGCSVVVSGMLQDLSRNHVEVTISLASNLQYCLTSLKSEGEALDASDLFIRMLSSAEVWLKLLENTRVEADVCFHFLRILLSSLVLAKNDDLGLALIKVCAQAMYRLLRSLLAGKEPSQDLLCLVRSKAFSSMRCDAQEELSKRKSYTHCSMAPRVRSLCELVSGLEVLQRIGATIKLNKNTRVTNAGFRGPDGAAFYGSKAGAGPGLLEFGSPVRPGTSSRSRKDLSISDLQTVSTSFDGSLRNLQVSVQVTASPQVVRALSYIVEVDLHPCAASALDVLKATAANVREATTPSKALGSLGTGTGTGRSFHIAVPTCPQSSLPTMKHLHSTPSVSDPSGSGPGPGQEKEVAIVEVAIAVAPISDDNDDEPPLYETVYCGSCLDFRQVGLSPSCTYLIRCRATAGGVVLDWSPPVEFCTDPGVSFTFDPLKCGPDIILGEGNLKASYAGDDNWSTLLGSQPFSAGKAGWEIRVTHSSTAYLFVGVATSEADLNTFLGGCSNGWGFIGEQALYHSRENVKGYGEAFSAGDFIGVSLDFHLGTLSFSRNGKQLGVAFDKICGELYPAVAFYNLGQELEIIPEGFRSSCSQEAVQCSPARLDLHGISMLNETFLCLGFGSMIPPRSLALIAEHCNDWCRGTLVRVKVLSGRYIFINTDKSSLLLKKYGIGIGERVRTPIGLAELRGVACNKLWFTFTETGSTWFFSNKQIKVGRERGYFLRCSYELEDVTAHTPHPTHTADGPSGMTFDSFFLQEIMDPVRWPCEMDCALLTHLSKLADSEDTSVWGVSCEAVCGEFRSLQVQLSRLVMNNLDLFHRWGISGPKRKAVIARFGFLRFLNHELDLYLPTLLAHTESSFHVSGVPTQGDDKNPMMLQKKVSDDFFPLMTSVKSDVTASNENIVILHTGLDSEAGHMDEFVSEGVGVKRDQDVGSGTGPRCPLTRFVSPPLISTSWQPLDSSTILSGGPGLIPISKHRIFSDIKVDNFRAALSRSAARPARTEDDYDYPDDLPTVKINRFKSFRAKEASEILGLPGEDLISSSMFCQLWMELKNVSNEKLRMSYSHPMDDGQSRTFKVKFEGEGVDDYGGPYREIFQLICDELQMPDPSVLLEKSRETEKGRKRADRYGVKDGEAEDRALKAGVRCFLPLLHPTPNFSSSNECEERYRYMFSPSEPSDLHLELYGFLGQLVGIAIRSKINLDLALPSYIWKCVAREPLSEKDLASFDAPASAFITRLSALHTRLTAVRDSFAAKTLQFKGEESPTSISLINGSLHTNPVTLNEKKEGLRPSAKPVTPLTSRRLVDSHRVKPDTKQWDPALSHVQRSAEADIDSTRDKSDSSDPTSLLALTSEMQELLQDLEWTYVRSDRRTVELIPGGCGKAVCVEDVGQYLQVYVAARLQEGQAAIQAFRVGLASIVPESAFALSCWEDVQRTVCGSRYIDINRLKENTEYDEDVTAEDPHIVFFWEILHDFTEEEKIQFLKFVWARPTLPPKGIEFLQKMKIQSAVGDEAQDKPDQYLPKAHTCFFSLNLPRYTTKELMAEKLRYAIMNCIEMDADFKLTEPDIAGWSLPSQQLSWSPMYNDD